MKWSSQVRLPQRRSNRVIKRQFKLVLVTVWHVQASPHLLNRRGVSVSAVPEAKRHAKSRSPYL